MNYHNQRLCFQAANSGGISPIPQKTTKKSLENTFHLFMTAGNPTAEIKQDLSEGRAEKALDRLESALSGKNSKWHDEIIQLKANLSDLNKKIRLGQINSEDESRSRSKLNGSILALLKAMEKGKKPKISGSSDYPALDFNWKTGLNNFRTALAESPNLYFLTVSLSILGMLILWSSLSETFNFETDNDVVGKVVLAASGIGLMLIVLTFNQILRKFHELGYALKHNHHFYHLMISAVVLLSISFVNQIFNEWNQEVMTINEEPEDPALWEGGEGHVKWFNGQFRLAGEELNETYLKSITEDNVKYDLLLFECRASEAEEHNFEKKFSLMRAFLQKMHASAEEDNKMISADNIRVRIKEVEKMPGLSYHCTVKKNDPTLIMYIEDGLVSGGIPEVALETQSDLVVKEFENQFDSFWDEARELELEKLLDVNVSDGKFFGRK